MADADFQVKEAATEAHSFQAEVAELLRLMVHSVYTETDIFLRELISNASDACDRLRYEAIASPELTAGDAPFVIRIAPDKDKGTLTISDNGIGMEPAGTHRQSRHRRPLGHPRFHDKLAEAKDGAGLIGQFGVGFYSAFMVADRIEVVSRRAGAKEAWAWTSSGGGGFEIAPASEEQAAQVPRGTEIVLHLKEDAKKYLERVRDQARRLDLFGSHPVPDRTRRRRGQGRADQFRERLVAAAKVGAEAGGIRRGLPLHRPCLRRARHDAALPGGGPAILRRAPVRPLDAALRSVRSGAALACEALRAACIHHGGRGTPALILALHARRRRQRGPAAEHLARDAAEQSASCADAQGADGPGHLGTGEPRREGRRRLPQDLGRIRRGHQGGPLRGWRKARRAHQACALHNNGGRWTDARSSMSPISSPIRPRFTISPAKARSDSSPIPNSKQRAIVASRCCC